MPLPIPFISNFHPQEVNSYYPPSLPTHAVLFPLISKNCSDSIFLKKKKLHLPPEDKYSIKDSQTCSNLVLGFKRGCQTALIESP